jgi:hypothetical protein
MISTQHSSPKKHAIYASEETLKQFLRDIEKVMRYDYTLEDGEAALKRADTALYICRELITSLLPIKELD